MNCSGKFAAAVCLALSPVPRVLAQGCVQCATSTNGLGVHGERALFKAMLVLLVPSLTILGGLAVVVYRNRNAGPVESLSRTLAAKASAFGASKPQV
jgi:hypothetical protein